CITGPEGVILMGNGSAKEGHNAVAQHLVHGALIAVHRVQHGMQGGVEQLLGGFGVEVADEHQRVFQVDKEHRDLLTLAWQGRARHADLLCQGYGERRAHVGWRPCSGQNWEPVPTRRAERRWQDDRLPTGGAGRLPWSATGDAEPRRRLLELLAYDTTPRCGLYLGRSHLGCGRHSL